MDSRNFRISPPLWLKPRSSLNLNQKQVCLGIKRRKCSFLQLLLQLIQSQITFIRINFPVILTTARNKLIKTNRRCLLKDHLLFLHRTIINDRVILITVTTTAHLRRYLWMVKNKWKWQISKQQKYHFKLMISNMEWSNNKNSQVHITIKIIVILRDWIHHQLSVRNQMAKILVEHFINSTCRVKNKLEIYQLRHNNKKNLNENNGNQKRILLQILGRSNLKISKISLWNKAYWGEKKKNNNN